MSVADDLVLADRTPIYGSHGGDCPVKGEPLAEPLSADKAEELSGIEATIEGIASRFVVFHEGNATPDSDFLVSLPYVQFLADGLVFIRRMRAIRSRLYAGLFSRDALSEEVKKMLGYCKHRGDDVKDGSTEFKFFHFQSCVGSECACEQPHPTTRGGTAEEGK